ncbi:MAG: hypothetical protein V4572_01715 [Bacteroidota bacterium]
MKNNSFQTVSKSFLAAISLFFSGILLAQQQAIPSSQQNNFWKNVQFGGGLGLSIGSGYTDISVSPSAIYNINSVFAVGTSLQFGYVSSKNFYTSTIYGASLIGLVNPIPEIQLSAELEEVNVDTNYKNSSLYDSENFWNTALYLGAGYRTGNVTIGARYNVLFKENKNYYNDAFMPFVRVYF